MHILSAELSLVLLLVCGPFTALGDDEFSFARLVNVSGGARLSNAMSPGKVIPSCKITHCLHMCVMEHRNSGRCSSVNYLEATSVCEMNDLHPRDDAPNIVLEPAESTVWLNPEFGPPIAPVIEITEKTDTTLTFSWTAGWNGGFEQFFTLEYKKSADTDFTLLEEDVYDEGEGVPVEESLTQLLPDTEYIIRLTASNVRPYGVSETVTNATVSTSYASSCSNYKNSGRTSSGNYTIDPDGENSGLEPFLVYCDMSTSPPNAVFHHDQEHTRRYIELEQAVLLRFTVTYTNAMAEIVSVINSASSCSQHFRRFCKGSASNFNGAAYSWWYGRSNVQRTYWGGSDLATGGCACYKTNSCNGNLFCNCDTNNDNLEFVDEGAFTTKDDLPFLKFYQGDLDENGEFTEVTLGPLKCTN